MKPAFFVKLASVLALGVCSSVVTSSVLAQVRSRKAKVSAASTAPIQSRTIDSRTGPVGSFAKPALPPERPAGTYAMFNLLNLKAEADGQGVKVFAHVDLQDAREHIKYMWSLTVVDADLGTPVSRINYDQQQFSLPPSRRSAPTFSETLNLPAGQYRVRLDLFEIPPGFDIKSLEGKDIQRSQRVLGGVRTVSVAG